MNMCHISNGFRDRAIRMYSCKIIDKKKILYTDTRNKEKFWCQLWDVT
jgi:hypothetical protein